MAAELSAKLFDAGMIDVVLCFSPSLSVAAGLRATFSQRLECPFLGNIANKGCSYTYQGMGSLGTDFWKSLEVLNVLIVFDEIHHCASGDTPNSWGEEIITNLQCKAKFTLALTGTPWRSDTTPIALASYSDPEGVIHCDYTYGLSEAVRDNVCRTPNIVVIDNDDLIITESSGEKKRFNSIADYLLKAEMPYSSLIVHQQMIEHILGLGCNKLKQLRLTAPSSAGLVVAASVKHAEHIAGILRKKYAQSVSIVTYKHDNSLEEIERFKKGSDQWIVSVGMISEGTDIPRLQVCCHLSRVKTELYFRQVLGRILRKTSVEAEQAWLYTIAEKNLVSYAERIAVDIPESHISFISANSEYQIVGRTPLKQMNKTVGGETMQQDPVLDLAWPSNTVELEHNRGGSQLSSLGIFRERLLSYYA